VFAISASLAATVFALDDMFAQLVVRWIMAESVVVENQTKELNASRCQIQTPTGYAHSYFRASGFGPKRGILLHPRNSDQNIIYFETPNWSYDLNI